MQTIIIVLNPKKMENPDLDIRYLLPERIEEITEGMVRDNGYDYLPNNDLSGAAEIYVSEENCADLDKCQKVYLI